ncbi:MAG: L-ribulose-5-phosphate 3-epimerase [Oscillospiraceae bacterium]|nr:L-ribulose-5-phosphate 3-epimerase [Oscillospiraceae bacterium]
MKAYTLGLYEKAMPEVSWPEKLRIAKNAGYDFVEISIDASEEKISRVYSSRAERRALVEQMYDCGMPIGTLNASALTRYALGDPDPEIRARSVSIAEHALGLAADLGARIVMIPGYDIYFGSSTPETEALFTENIRRLTLLAARCGVQLGFETMENEFMNTVEKAMHYVRLMDSNYLKVYPDIGNTTNAAVLYGTDVLEDLRRGRGHLAAIHLKETKPGRFREIPYGSGHVDFEAAIRTAWELGVRRFVTEFWYLNGREKPADVRARFAAILDRQEGEMK